MNARDVLDRLARWRAEGRLRALDLAFVRFLHEQDAQAPASLLFAAGRLAELEGQGHTALPPAELPADARTEWAGCALLEIDPPDDRGASPLVLGQAGLQLRRDWRQEGRIAARLRARAAAAPALDEAALQAALDSVVGPAAHGAQRAACAAVARGRLALITGGPGTGKTWTAARALALVQALHTGDAALRVGLAAPTGKAAARLRQAIDAALPGTALPPARTLHALLGARPGSRRFAHDADNPLPLDLLFVDEASMVHLELMDALLAALPPAARLVLLGDRDQLASVEAGAVMADLCAAPALAAQTVALTHTHRFGGAIAALAQAVNAGDGAAALALLQAGEGGLAMPPVAGAGAAVATALAGHAAYLAQLRARPAAAADFEPWVHALRERFDGFRALCALREGAWGAAGLCAALERAMQAQGLLDTRAEAYAGRPVMVTRNAPALGVFNGDVGLLLHDPADGRLRAWFADGEGLRAVSVGRLPPVECAFASTVHKSQGSEFGHVALLLPPDDSPLLTRELVYTGITRARQAFTLLAPEPARLAQAVARRTRRVGGLPGRLA